ncbi:MAG TPA: flagellar biosynthesis protein FlgE [Clostridium sp.]|jgi:flagellar hook protein FlgE|uniref:flagellar hook-basal body protein n=1 Tax=uncultured Clostridium sp. TaxID=59620 RepID=UPI000E939653|nr:flagellar hook-basal body complex protein [uncultured Clostridium sp.]HBC95893.1 flagellar biosynthesis protein FlgE [Clostridium sp.]
MLPSLYSGISGLKANQQKLNVVANNIANSTTTGFKTQSMNFEDTLSQNLSDPSAPVDGGLGGINPKQSGLGVKISGINTDFSEGSPQTTNRKLDFMIDKSGSYFVVSLDGTEDYYTRDGAFVLDADGNLLTQDGYHVMGYNQDTVGNNEKPATELSIKQYYSGDYTGANTGDENDKVTSYSIGADGIITVKTKGEKSWKAGRIALASFTNEGGLLKQGNNLYSDSTNSGNPIYGTAGTSAYGKIISGSLEMSNVDLAQQFTDMIVASRAFEANGKIITTDDEILQDLVNLKR